MEDGDDVSERVLEHLGVVDKVLAYLGASWPRHVDRDDLYSAGQIALVESARRWDPGTGVPFDRYAQQRIRGAMLDALRDADWAPRSVRSRTRQIDEAKATLRHRLRREPTTAEIAEDLDLSPRQVGTALAGRRESHMLSVDAPIDGSPDRTHAELLLCPSTGAERRVEDLELRAELAGAIAALDERSKAVITGIYLEGRMLADIGAELGVTESRVSQVHHAALHLLNEMLRRGWERLHGDDSVVVPERRSRTYLAALERYRDWYQDQRGRLLADPGVDS